MGIVGGVRMTVYVECKLCKLAGNEEFTKLNIVRKRMGERVTSKNKTCGG